MKFLDAIRADIKKEAAEQERQLVLKVLQRRSGDLTLGELFQVLGSPMGQGLHAVRVAELFATVAPAATSGTSPGATDSRQSMKKKTTTAKAKARRAGRKHGAKKPQPPPADDSAPAAKRAARARTKPSPPKVSALTVEGRKQYDAALLNFLRKHPGPNRPADIRSVVGGSDIQFRIAMDRLRTAGLVERLGQFGTTTYAAKGGAAGSSEVQAEKPRTAKKSAKKQAAASQSSKPIQADDTAVLGAIQELGGWVSSSQILSKVGGSIDALRESLKRLVTSGSVRREGERKFTRYAVTSVAG